MKGPKKGEMNYLQVWNGMRELAGVTQVTVDQDLEEKPRSRSLQKQREGLEISIHT